MNNIPQCIAIQSDMVSFVCDTCGRVKNSGEIWINGIAAESVGTQAARREVIVDPLWRYERAVQPFAVHFCSVECKDKYLAQLFQKPVKLLEVEEVAGVPGSGMRLVRARKTGAKEVLNHRTDRSGTGRH